MSVGASSTIFSPVYPAFFSASGEISRGPVRFSNPAALAIGVPGQKYPTPSCHNDGSVPTIACM